MFKSRQQKKAEASIEQLFAGLDDPILKQIILTVHAGSDPKILEEMQGQEQKEMEEIIKQMELQNKRIEEIDEKEMKESLK